jgi:hypothetical protein
VRDNGGLYGVYGRNDSRCLHVISLKLNAIFCDSLSKSIDVAVGVEVDAMSSSISANYLRVVITNFYAQLAFNSLRKTK